jgi:hypothetical protein
MNPDGHAGSITTSVVGGAGTNGRVIGIRHVCGALIAAKGRKGAQEGLMKRILGGFQGKLGTGLSGYP